jgi:mannose-6-phosphate isomerase-like protein (cupin superfamily)
MSRRWLFESFFFGGFEASTHRTVEGYRMDLIAATQHDRMAAEDYALCRSAGIRAVREAARWPLIDQEGRLALDEIRRLARLGREKGLIQIWDLMHYGYPDDLDPFSPDFRDRFVAYASAVAAVIKQETPGPAWFTPINEISYYSWAGAQVGYMAPFAKGRGAELKRALVQASIDATNAMWRVAPDAMLLNVDPLIRVHPPAERPDLQERADHFNSSVVTEAFDMLAGRIAPELGGSRAHLGIIGLNYYACNQWTIATPEQPQRFLDWHDPRWIPLPDLLAGLERRYGGPLIIAETGNAGEGRPGWLAHLAAQAQDTLAGGVNLQGICWYPLITSPDWEDPTAFFDGGLFDVVPEPGGGLRRVLARPVALALREAQAELDPANMPGEPLGPESLPEPPPAPDVLRPLDQARFKPDNFSWQTLAAGNSLLVEVYGLEPGASVTAHRHAASEHVLTVLAGEANIRVGPHWVTVRRNQTVLVPAGLYHGLHNAGVERLIVQQVSGPKPWDARFRGPYPSAWETEHTDGE